MFSKPLWLHVISSIALLIVGCSSVDVNNSTEFKDIEIIQLKQDMYMGRSIHTCPDNLFGITKTLPRIYPWTIKFDNEKIGEKYLSKESGVFEIAETDLDNYNQPNPDSIVDYTNNSYVVICKELTNQNWIEEYVLLPLGTKLNVEKLQIDQNLTGCKQVGLKGNLIPSKSQTSVEIKIIWGYVCDDVKSFIKEKFEL